MSQSGDVGAAYHLAKQYEAKDMAQQAIQFYQRAGRFNHAIRLAKAHNLAGELNMMAINAPSRNMSEAATYFEEQGQPDRAVALYQKSGNIAKAVELCFKASSSPIESEPRSSSSAQPPVLPCAKSLPLPHSRPSPRPSCPSPAPEPTPDSPPWMAQARLFEQLRDVAENLPADSDPALIQRCAEFFMDHGQYEKTVRLFAVAGECAKALDL